MPLAYLLHDALRGVLPALKDPPAIGSYALLAFLTLPLWLLLLRVFGLDRIQETTPSVGDLILALVKVHGTGFLGVTTMLFVTQGILNRSLVALFLGCTFTLLLLEKVAISAWVRHQVASGHGARRLLLVGPPDAPFGAFGAPVSGGPPHIVAGWIRVGDAPGEHADLACLGPLADLEEVLHREPVDALVLFPPLGRPEDSPEVLDVAESLGIPVAFHVPWDRERLPPPQLEDLGGTPALVYSWRERPPEMLALKHGCDALLSFLGLVALSPVFLLAAAAIRVTMGAPIFFVQERIGLNGRRFPMYKFRTMVAGAEAARAELEAANEMDGPVFKIKEDPRITPLGRFLRRTSIDELPQLLNVLRGQMSLVGPRPLPVKEQDKIRGGQRRRLSMKPGITGLWQVSGRNDIGFDDWMRMDLEYVDGWTPWLDVGILLRTLPAVFSGRGAS